MTILLNKDNRVVVQGVTGKQGSFHTRLMREYGTKVVAGSTPGKGGETVDGIPVYDTVYEARKLKGVDTSIIFVPAMAVYDAAMESLFEGIRLVVVITEHVPPNDAMKLILEARNRGAVIIGPNCPGLISPGESKVGIMPSFVYDKGRIGVVSRSGTLTYEIAWELTRAGLGQSTVIGLGGDPVTGLGFIDALRMFQNDSETDAVLLIGEIGGDAEEKAAKIVGDEVTKPIVAYVAGRSAPEGKRMGHAGAIISAGTGSVENKVKVLGEAGVRVANLPDQVPALLREALKR